MNLNQFMNINEDKQNLIELCCGCGACVQGCPKDAISFKLNNKGFEYPYIDDEKCVSCGICVKKCQYINESEFINTYKEPKVYAVINKDCEELKRSSSGGAAFIIAKSIIDQEGIVFGAVYTDTMEVVHKKIDNIDELKKTQGSKYVQSNIGRTYVQAKEELKKGKKVLFIGTPCQIGGLYTFLSKEYNDLYTVDIICYGVPSPVIFKDYVKWKESKLHSKIKDINFRNKILGWGDSVTEIITDRGTKLNHSVNDEWYQTFLAHVLTRESCYHCKYTNINRKSDITLGDFWGIENFSHKLSTEKGLSKVLVSTKKGEKLFESVKEKMIFEKMEVNSAIRPNLLAPPEKVKNSDKFYRDYKNKGFYYAFKNNVKQSISLKIKVKKWIKIKLRSKANL